MRNILAIITILCLATACFPTEWFEPEFADTEVFHNLEIPAEGSNYEIPFEFLYYETRTSWPMKTYQIRVRFIFNDVPGEIYDAAANESPIYWNWDWKSDTHYGYEKAIMHVYVPANETSDARTVAAQISIDNIANRMFTIEEGEEHDWGEWITILDGIQAGQQSRLML